MLTQIESYDKQCPFFCIIKSFWLILYNQSVINTIKNLNCCNKTTSPKR